MSDSLEQLEERLNIARITEARARRVIETDIPKWQVAAEHELGAARTELERASVALAMATEHRRRTDDVAPVEQPIAPVTNVTPDEGVETITAPTPIRSRRSAGAA